MDSTEALSSVLGWVSIGCWMIVYSPQFIENYQLKSGEGLSIAFVVTWLVGDLANFIGAILAQLIPTLVLLAVYYSLCDIGLLCQIYYYRYTHPVYLSAVEPAETAPLLPSVQKDGPAPRHLYRRVLAVVAPYALGTFFVLSVGTAAYWIHTNGSEDHQGDKNVRVRKDVLEWRSQLLGWISAVLYLGSRIPQIIKNLETKCAGLSPVLFVFGIAGNATYVASILVVSTEAKYLLVNSSWLAGSGLTIFLDLIILAQFLYFGTIQRVFVPDENASETPSP